VSWLAKALRRKKKISRRKLRRWFRAKPEQVLHACAGQGPAATLALLH